MKGMLSINVSRCTGCKTCEIECAVAHSVSKTLAGVIHDEEKVQKRIFVESAGSLSVPLQCRHCEDAPCIAACPTKPTKAMYRNGSGFPVLVKEDLCIGCRACLVACPFGVISMGVGRKIVVKCDLCVHRLAKGQKPACAAGCPTKAITFTTADRISGETRKKTAESFLVAIERGSAG